MLGGMNKLRALFTEHPASVGETYLQHLASASGFALRMLAAGVCCFVHALLPFVFVRTGSNAVALLHDRMIVNRSRLVNSTEARGHARPGPVGAS